MAKHEKQAFRNTAVALDGQDFEACTFDGCSLEYEGNEPVSLRGSTLNNCTWVFKGPAANAVQLMGALYQSGAQGALLVEATFNQIRGLVPPAQAGASAAVPGPNEPAPRLQ